MRNYYLVLVYLGFAYVVCRVLVTSHFGRVLVAIRENEDRARFLGYDVQRYKMGVCMISALLTGLGGALYPRRSAFATPDLMLWTDVGRVHHHGDDRRAGHPGRPDHRRRLLHPAPGEGLVVRATGTSS